MSNHVDLVASAQLLYVAYYGRPADPGGLDFWIERFGQAGSIDLVLVEFGTSAEYTNSRANVATEDLINGLYLQMFNRAADDDGLAFYTDRLDSGAASLASIALDIANGARDADGRDWRTLQNKVEVANEFTELIRVRDVAYTSADIPDAQTLLADVSSFNFSLENGFAAASELVNQLGGIVIEPTDPTDPTDPVDPAIPPPPPRDPGKSYTLTAPNADASDNIPDTDGKDAIPSGTGNDRFTANDKTLGQDDRIQDDSTTDRDVMNLILRADLGFSPSIVNVETINITFETDGDTPSDPEKTSTGTLDAANIKGALLRLSANLNFEDNHEFIISNVGDNSVAVVSRIDVLRVTGLEGGSVNGGSADMVTVTGDADTENSITVSGVVTLTNIVSTKTTLTTSGSSTVTYDTSADITTTVKGSGNLVLKMASEDITGKTLINEKSSGTLILETTDTGDFTFDSSKFEVDTVRIVSDDPTATPNVAATVADGQAIAVVLKDPEVTNPPSTPAKLSSLTITSDTARAKISISTSHAIDTLDVSDSDVVETSITAGRDLTITTLNAGANTIILSGSRDITINTITSTDGAVINAANLRGDLTIDAHTGSGRLTASGGRGTNHITAGESVDTKYSGGQGADTVDASGVTSGSLDLELNGGNDVLIVGGNSVAGLVIAYDGGSGTDVIRLKHQANLEDARLALRGVEQFELENIRANNPDTVDATLAGSHLSGASYTIFTVEEGDTATLKVEADTASTDLSSLRLRNIDVVEITGETTVETIVGTSADDTITSNGGADRLTGGAGDDTFVFGSGDSTQTAMARITDYKASDGVNTESDTIDLSSTDIAIDVDDVDVSSVVEGGGNNISAYVDDGIVTLFGLDRRLIDTLAEWIAVLEVNGVVNGAAAFEFGGNTYLMADGNTIELTGVTGITAISETAADNTLLIA
ncbi:MAG: DUF4214 domain-containing protein [Halieaceae bacterium]|nr:DUF4214 domain-containing protein [Halieaceae bacterium]